MHFMLQKEVVDRMAAAPHSKEYGRLSIITQAVCDVESLFDVPPDAFYPAPKVTSAVVRLRSKSIQPSQNALNRLSNLTQLAFQQRRKQLRNTLGKHIKPEVFEALGIQLTDRPEDLSVDQYLKLAEYAGS
jgi:16S rRNA (adenine1518-N6/adenine1519-N6)-dimethyltransferase